MEISTHYHSNTILIVFFLVIFSVNCYAIPTPFCFVMMELAARPVSLTPTIYSLPTQQAQANALFKFNIKRFIGLSRPEITYRLTNISTNHDGTKYIVGTITGVSGLPAGMVRLTNRPDDCSPQLELGTREVCFLRFYLDTNQVTSLQGGGGPFVSAHIAWAWGSHKNRDGGQNLSVTPSSTANNFANILAPILLPTHIQVTPSSQAGLYYNPETSSIEGYPTRTGVYIFTINATNGAAIAAPQTLQINVDINPHDTPVFKPTYSFASAMPEQEYRLNLIDLIQPTPGLTQTNQLSFRIDLMRDHPDWLSLDKDNATLLQGHVPSYEAGKIKEVTIIATSNTGGDSQPFTIKIPIAFDPEKKTIIEQGVELTGSAGAAFHNDFRANITDPTADAHLKLILDKVEPDAPWLSMSSWNPTGLDGVVPLDSVGQTYQLTFHANTTVGGNSDPVIIPLNILINKNKTPYFYSDNPQFSPLYVGQSYVYDFVINNDIYPEYTDIPYLVELAKDYDNPEWLRITDNKLIADKVPDDAAQVQEIFLTLKNIPGGKSEVLPFLLIIMN